MDIRDDLRQKAAEMRRNLPAMRRAERFHREGLLMPQAWFWSPVWHRWYACNLEVADFMRSRGWCVAVRKCR